MAQNIQISQHNILYIANEKSHDHFKYAEKAGNKLQHFSVVKTLNEINLEETYLNTLKTLYEYSTMSIINHKGRQKFLFNSVLKILDRAIRHEKK